jgi:3-deoxy-D-arabino-heptulosonate 7-phosphate (DAHP) synthase
MEKQKKTLHFQRKVQHKILKKTRKRIQKKIVPCSEHDRHIK